MHWIPLGLGGFDEAPAFSEQEGFCHAVVCFHPEQLLELSTLRAASFESSFYSWFHFWEADDLKKKKRGTDFFFRHFSFIGFLPIAR